MYAQGGHWDSGVGGVHAPQHKGGGGDASCVRAGGGGGSTLGTGTVGVVVWDTAISRCWALFDGPHRFLYVLALFKHSQKELFID